MTMAAREQLISPSAHGEEPAEIQVSHQERESSPILPSLPPQEHRSTSGHRSRPILPTRLSSSRRKPFLRHKSSDYNANSSEQCPKAQAETEADLAAAFNTSSDPAFFSSDETPGLENYTQDGNGKRKKKVYSGTWWSGRLRSGSNSSSGSNVLNSNQGSQNVSFSGNGGRKRRKRDREFRRNFDSGIFMADEMEMGGSSSGADLSSDGLFDELEAERSKTLEMLQFHGNKSHSCKNENTKLGTRTPTATSSTTRPFKKLSLHDIIAQRPSPLDTRISEIVTRCLEKGESDIDLTNMGIEILPQTIIELRTLVKSQDPINLSFGRLSTRLRIYLANNRLSLFPGHLLKIPNIELLSVRQNQITRFPDGIIDLKHLRELNISGNNFEFLPFSILKLCDFRLKTIQSDPNPWKSLSGSTQLLPEFPRLIINQPGRSIRRLGVEMATRFEAAGTIQPTILTKHSRTTQTTRRSPFMSELVLRQLDKLHTAGTDLSVSSDTELCSDNVREMLHKLYLYQHEGRRICTFCDRPIILPKYQWLEWWQILDFDLVRRDLNDTPRFQINIPQNKDGDDDSDEDSTSDENMQEENVTDVYENGKTLSGLVLPFIRTSCGCRTQPDGLTEEKEMFEELARSDKNKDNSGYRVWPTLGPWKSR